MRKIINAEGQEFVPVSTDDLVLDAVPTVNSFNSVTSDAVARAVAGASGEVPQVTESDNGKVLSAIYDAGGPAVEWAEAPSGLPDTTGASQGDVLSIGSTGPEWAAPSGGGSAPTWSNWVNGYYDSQTDFFRVEFNGNLEDNTTLLVELEITETASNFKNLVYAKPTGYSAVKAGGTVFLNTTWGNDAGYISYVGKTDGSFFGGWEISVYLMNTSDGVGYDGTNTSIKARYAKLG